MKHPPGAPVLEPGCSPCVAPLEPEDAAAPDRGCWRASCDLSRTHAQPAEAAQAAAQPSDSTSACSNTVSVAFSCLSGG